MTVTENAWIIFLYIVAVYPLVMGAVGLITYSFSIFYAIFIFEKLNKTRNGKVYSALIDSDRGVSILKPLMGVDKFQQENLESHFNLKYNKLQLILCIQDQKDPIVEVVEKLREKYPNVDCEVVIDQNDIINPMVSNMANGYTKIKYDYIWVSTSRIKASDSILNDLISKAEDPNVAMVHQLPFICDENTFANVVDKISFGCYFARNYIFLNVFGASCVTGMSYLIKKKILDDVGGLPYFGKYLAEDFFLSAAIHKKGYHFRLSAFPAQQQAPTSLKNYISRMTRWMRLRLNMILLVVIFFEFLTECLPLALMLSFSANYIFGLPHLWIFFSYIGYCFILDFILITSIQGGLLPVPIHKYVAAWIVRELLVIFIFIKAFSNPQRIKWGPRTYKLHIGGLTEVLSDERQ